MKFCKICNSLYYIRNEGNKLMLHCKRCNSNDTMEDNEKICIKITDNSESYSTSNIRNNKYIFKDPTLPRVDNSVVKCINNECLTNNYNFNIYIYRLNKDDIISVKKFFSDLDISVDNINIILSEENMKIDLHINSKHKKEIIYNIIGNKSIKINGKSVLFKIDMAIILLGLSTYNPDIIKYIADEYSDYNVNEEDIEIKYNSSSHQHIIKINKINSDIYDKLVNFINENKSFIYKETPCVLNIIFNSEIVFIKYDEVNLKYIYLCSACNSSWVNNIKVNN